VSFLSASLPQSCIDRNVYIYLCPASRSPRVIRVQKLCRTSRCHFSCLSKNIMWRHGATLFFDSNLDSCPEPVYTACFTNCIHINNNIVHTLSLPQASRLQCSSVFILVTTHTYRLLISFPTTRTFGDNKKKKKNKTNCHLYDCYRTLKNYLTLQFIILSGTEWADYYLSVRIYACTHTHTHIYSCTWTRCLIKNF